MNSCCSSPNAAAVNGCLKCLTNYLDFPVSPAAAVMPHNYPGLFRYAAMHGQHHVFDFLRERGHTDSKAMRFAATEGHTETVKWLDKKFFPRDHAVELAIWHGRVECVRWMLTNGFHEPSAMYYAAETGQTDVMLLLIELGFKLEQFHISLAKLRGHDAFVQKAKNVMNNE